MSLLTAPRPKLKLTREGYDSITITEPTFYASDPD